MFHGVSTLSLDEKGRIAIPKRYRPRLREECAAKLITTVDLKDRCLLLYPEPQWRDVERKIMSLSTFDDANRRLQRMLVGHAAATEMDGQGRVLLPAELRDYADLRIKERGVLIGQGARFELWDEQHWTEQRKSWIAENNAGGLEASMEMLNLSI